MKYLFNDFYKEMTFLDWGHINFLCFPFDFQNLENPQQIEIHLNFKAFPVRLNTRCMC